MNKVHLLLATLLILFIANPSYAGIFDKDFGEFVKADEDDSLGFSTILLGGNGNISFYVCGVDLNSQGQITISGRRTDFAQGATLNSTTVNVTATGNLSNPTTETSVVEIFTKRISGRNVELRKEIITKNVFTLAQFSDGCLMKGYWRYNLEREQTATVRNGRVSYSWKNLDDWFSGEMFSWYQDKIGREQIGDDFVRR